MDEERVPMLVGCGRHTARLRNEDISKFPSPMDLVTRAVNIAAEDLGIGPSRAAAALREADAFATVNICAVGVPAMSGGDHKFYTLYPNAPLTLAQRYGAAPVAEHCFSSLYSGHGPQLTVNALAELIGRGEVKCAVVGGCEFLNLLKAATAQGYKLSKPGTKEEGSEKILRWGDPQKSKPKRPGSEAHHKLWLQNNVHEARNGMVEPISVYPLYEQALRGALGRSTEEHMGAVSEMWATFSEVAAEQPEHSWFPTARSAREIQHPDGVRNRFVGYPYTKYHCSVLDVDQSAALIIMSVAEARRRGVPEAKWVYLHGCAETLEKESLFRPGMHRSPAIEMMGKQCFQQANVSVDQISQFDLYSCFPCAVEIAVNELGIKPSFAEDARKLTVTGGLSFHGGPGANYVMHSIAAMMEHVRARPGTFGMVTANGGFLAKHAAGIYSTTPYLVTHPEAVAWTRRDPKEYQALLDAVPDVTVAEAPAGLGRVEAYTVMHSQKGPKQAICVGTVASGDDEGKRFVAVSRSPEVMAEMVQRDLIGKDVRLVPNAGGEGKHVFQLQQSAKL
eukprot:TRINITY_DN14876_c0_g1_i4.p1 TRINITY_DN14876_c0_g1~~TRINITY_DN14876_c0_g1_i4.p1  ORF type:complete len:595 (+),score=97.09 TRINITY_DN14876_c0_g1_i4:97-1785(+)